MKPASVAKTRAAKPSCWRAIFLEFSSNYFMFKNEVLWWIGCIRLKLSLNYARLQSLSNSSASQNTTWITLLLTLQSYVHHWGVTWPPCQGPHPSGVCEVLDLPVSLTQLLEWRRHTEPFLFHSPAVGKKQVGSVTLENVWAVIILFHNDPNSAHTHTIFTPMSTRTFHKMDSM